jgi:F-type H+-transporting ATPase subunit b
MGVNATLIGQMITFALLVLFTMKFVWPPIIRALKERQQTITDGLAAAERASRDLELAQHKVADIMREARLDAAKMIEVADKRTTQLIEEAKLQARQEAEKIMEMGRAEILKDTQNARLVLSRDIASIALASAEKLLGRQLDSADNHTLLNELIAEVSNE